jgi:molybdopterin/thiamine biosynthesis adenylyltransferase
MTKRPFTEEQIERYSRHIILNKFGPLAQKKLNEGSVLIIGAGGLGSSALIHCASSGIGTIGIADYDNVNISNLQRQILYSEIDCGQKKVSSAANRLRLINHTITINEHIIRIDALNILDIIKQYDFVIDGTDSINMKLLINDACVLQHIPFCHAGAIEFSGQIMSVIPGKSACLRCCFNDFSQESQSCSQMGIMGPVTGIIGTIQAFEAIKYISQTCDLLINSILSFQGERMRFHKFSISRNILCEVCGENPKIKNLQEETYALCQ